MAVAIRQFGDQLGYTLLVRKHHNQVRVSHVVISCRIHLCHAEFSDLRRRHQLQGRLKHKPHRNAVDPALQETDLAKRGARNIRRNNDIRVKCMFAVGVSRKPRQVHDELVLIYAQDLVTKCRDMNKKSCMKYTHSLTATCRYHRMLSFKVNIMAMFTFLHCTRLDNCNATNYGLRSSTTAIAGTQLHFNYGKDDCIDDTLTLTQSTKRVLSNRTANVDHKLT